ncbi:type II toxin-antitoxin system death-on-curing family toxin [Microbacterium sp. NEAU-LLC]|uniref:Type II toxin-antitoxin system death-on-curing family toxin n=1 Tax=Microbacterium helvum TaxID=2773713 RepID=A0ABR8NVJ4_9MICO|nr:type II toxin-antitoxin system death-on-curing family toxin [Microbacterium helvum]MBD3943762.1 type II toxin-antitoxin system death-on-curing family toxin [Microbacterium helvum]
MTEFLTLDDALHIARRLGFHVRDAGLLASALARPATTLFGDDAYPTLSLKAAAFMESVVRNHPFVDGNKRSGWTLTVTFLWLNGYRHDMTTDEGFDLVIGAAEGRVDLDASAAVWESYLVPRA